MKILICGLGLMGGSLARALKYYHNPSHASDEHEIHGYDPDPESVRKALLAGACDWATSELPPLSSYEVLVLSAYPRASVDFLHTHASELSPKAYVFDLGGIKRAICEAGFSAAEQYGFTFIGGHPMAGTQFSGFEASRESLFKNASMILIPPEKLEKEKLDFAARFFYSVGCASVQVTTARQHDAIIAYTSQLAHVLSNAYVKSPTAKLHRGYSAGSFRDLTRVAHLNPRMWAELFMDNRDMLIPEIQRLAASLTEYADAMQSGDEELLRRLLEQGSAINDEIKA